MFPLRMPSTRLLFRFIMLLLAGLVTSLGSFTLATAQEASPAAGEAGVTFELIGLGPAASLPLSPADVLLFRISLDPGAGFPIEPPANPELVLAVVESGAVTLLVDTPITVLHPTTEGMPGPDDFETMAAGDEFLLEEGDSALFP